MIRRTVVVGLVLLTAALLQTSFLPFLALNGFRPDLLLLVTIAFALRDGAMTGLRVGFAAGVLTDLLLNAAPIGLTAIVYIAVAYAVGIAKPYLAPDSATAPLMLGGVGTLLGVAGYGILGLLLGEFNYALTLVVRSAVVSAVYAVLLAPIVMGLIRAVSKAVPPELRTAN